MRADFAAAGLEPPPLPNEYEVWPENWDALQLFLACSTQWRYSGMTGAPTGLDYTAVMAVLPMYSDVPRDTMDRVRILEATALRELRKQRETA